jgi:UDP-galactopyranose mutase
MQVDYLIVGAGLFGSVVARQLTDKGKLCLVIDQRSHIGGNCYTEVQDNITIHKYGAHIFHTSNKEVWDYANKYAEFMPFINQPIAMVDTVPFNMPFNMNMFAKLFGVGKPAEAQEIIRREQLEYALVEPMNLEDQAIKLVGKTIYEMFVKGYTEKQWGVSCRNLPADTIKRLPVRFTYDNNYFDDVYQGIPKGGYTNLINALLKNVEVWTDCSFTMAKELVNCQHIVYTGMIDEFFGNMFGFLDYRSLEFVEVKKDTKNYQGVAVVNYPSLNVPYTRSIEHRHFDKNCVSDTTIISYEFSKAFDRSPGMIPYYPIGNRDNLEKYQKYHDISKGLSDVTFAGRLGEYKYYDMDDTIEKALQLSSKLSEH